MIGEVLVVGVGTAIVVGVVGVEEIEGSPELGERVDVSGVAATEGNAKDVLVTL